MKSVLPFTHDRPEKRRSVPARAMLALLAILFIFPVLSAPALAQVSAPAPDKVEQLLDLLDDPTVKEWLAARRAPAAAAADDAAVPVVDSEQGMMSSALDRVKAHLTRLAHTWPLIPQRFDTARQVVMKDVGDRGGLSVVALVALFVGVGATLSYIAFRLSRPLRLWVIAQDMETP